MPKNPTKLHPITAERFERELAALNRIYNAGLITSILRRTQEIGLSAHGKNLYPAEANGAARCGSK